MDSDNKQVNLPGDNVYPPVDGATIEELLMFGERLFLESEIYFGHGTDNAWDEAVLLLFYALDLPPDTDRSALTQVLNHAQQKAITSLYEVRVTQRSPAAYITGQAWFCGLSFMVDPRVIVPRSPIGSLIREQFQPWLLEPPARVLDLCTGSGCIGISCAYAFEHAEVVMSDISSDAIDIAMKNIEHHALGDRITAVQSDLFANINPSHFDLIVSNPPYVDADDFQSMPEEFRHEPSIALESGMDGLDFTRRLLVEAEHYLSPKGVLIVEVGNSSVALEEAFPLVPFLWFEFEEGDGGVFMLTRKQLIDHRELFL